MNTCIQDIIAHVELKDNRNLIAVKVNRIVRLFNIAKLSIISNYENENIAGSR